MRIFSIQRIQNNLPAKPRLASTYLKYGFVPMVFIIDGCSLRYAHTWSKSGISICWRHLVTSKESSNSIFFFEKRPCLHHTCATWNEQPSNINPMLFAEDSGVYQCDPSLSYPKSVTVHIINIGELYVRSILIVFSSFYPIYISFSYYL